MGVVLLFPSLTVLLICLPFYTLLLFVIAIAFVCLFVSVKSVPSVCDEVDEAIVRLYVAVHRLMFKTTKLKWVEFACARLRNLLKQRFDGTVIWKPNSNAVG